MSITPSAPPVFIAVDPQISFFPTTPSAPATASDILRAQQMIDQSVKAHQEQGLKTATLELVGKQTVRSDSPESQTMEDGECCNDCRSCVREVCTLENCCLCMGCLCRTICCVVQCVLGAKEAQRGQREHDPFKTFVGVEAMGGNSTAVALSAWDQYKH